MPTSVIHLETAGVPLTPTDAASAISGLAPGHYVTGGSGTYRIASNATLPAGVSLDVKQGQVFQVDSGTTLTIAGKFSAGPIPVFTGTGNVMFSQGATEYLDPRWWGAPADGVGDDGPAIHAAGQVAKVTGIPVRLPEGDLVIGGSTLPVLDNASHNVTIQGAGSGLTRIRRPSGSIAFTEGINNPALRLFYVRNAAGSKIRVAFSGMYINDNHAGNPFPSWDPNGDLEHEHNHCIQIVARDAEGIDEVRVSDVAIHDPNSDGVSIGANTGGWVGDIFMREIRETGRNRNLRSGACVTGPFRTWFVADSAVENLELELNETNTQPCRMYFASVDVSNKFDINPKLVNDSGPIPSIRATGVNVNGKMNTGLCAGKFEGCRFELREPWRIQKYRWEFINCDVHLRSDFGIPANTSTGGAIYLANDSGADLVSFLGCRFTNESALAQLTYYFTTVHSTNSTKKEYEFRACTFSGPLPAIYWRAGKLVVEGCEFGSASGAAIFARGLLTTFPNEMHIRNNRMRADAYLLAAPITTEEVCSIWMRGNVNTVSAFKVLDCRETNVLVRGRVSSTDLSAPTAGITFQELDDYTGTAAPTTGRWLKGTRINYPAPSAGGYMGLVCTQAGNTSIDEWKGWGAIEP